jgi:putative membrane protein
MSIVAAVLVALVALLHVYILILEMFLWTSPRGQKAFGTTPEFAQQTKVLAANQGLYNGFLAAGLIWSILHPLPEFGWQIAMFFLACIAVAGIYGAATASRKIIFIQTVPAVIAMLAVIFL